MAFEAQIAENTAIDIYQWRAYTQVATVPGVAGHATVNHSVNFVDPQTGIHTQHIESYWNQVKVKLKRMRGCATHQIDSYLSEFMWRERHGLTPEDAWNNILRDIAIRYSV
jgi:hypothetical protein